MTKEITCPNCHKKIVPEKLEAQGRVFWHCPRDGCGVCIKHYKTAAHREGTTEWNVGEDGESSS